MARYYVDWDEYYPFYEIYDKKESWIRHTVELTEDEAKAFTAAMITFRYWQRVIGERVSHAKNA